MAIVLLLWAQDHHSYDYYTILRFVVCGTSSYGAYLAYESEKKPWLWLFGGIAILFNPFLKIYFQKSNWTIIDIATAFVFLISILAFRKWKVL